MQKLIGLMRKAIQKYDMIQPGDRIAVGVSGGKDSVALLAGLAKLREFMGIDYEIVAITLDYRFGGVDSDFSELQKLCDELKVEYIVKPTEIGQIIFDIRKESNPCSLCARMRRGCLHDAAKENNCNKIALGHHYDDVIETILMGMLHGGQIQTMMPKLHSTNFEGMELIRPMYLIRESDICRWRDYNDLHFLQCACHFTDTCTTCHTDGTTSSKRLETKQLIAALKKDNPFVEANIFKSIENVNLDTVIGYKKAGVRHSFLEEY